jgi:chaperonin GroES
MLPNQGTMGGQPLQGISNQLQAPEGVDPSLMNGMSPPQGPAPTPQEPEDPHRKLQGMIEMKNIAEKLDEEVLNDISRVCKEGFEQDLDSRATWWKETEEWVKIAKQMREQKSFPWPDASNIKYPLITTASMQFNARAYPSLVPNDGQVVKAQVFGEDPDDSKSARAQRIERYMSYQTMHELPLWEEEMDHLLTMVPVVGMVFKKTYYDSYTEKATSRVVLAENLVINYWAKSLEEAERKSEIIRMSARELKSRQMDGVYCDIDLGTPDKSEDRAGFYELVECHCYYDIDKDGYEEPYIVLFERRSSKILRITARFASDSIKLNKKKKIVRVEPIEYYTKFGFIKSIDGSFYDVGFGQLLGPINEAVNTNINQLTDAGTLSNMASGFLGKGLKLKQGNQTFFPGEWKVIAATADDLRKQIVPMPSKDPSPVLLQLMQILISSGKELASVADIFVGKMPGQNTPATTTMQTVEQGMKLFTAIYKRLYRSLGEEFRKLYRINYLYFDRINPSEFDENLVLGDFNSNDHKVQPAADPSVSSQTEKLMKAQSLMELMPVFGPAGLLDPKEILFRQLQAQEQPNWQKLIPGMSQTGQPQPPPQQQQPDPKAMLIQQQMQQDQEKHQQQQDILEKKAAADQQKAQLDIHGKQMDLAATAQANHDAQQHAQAMNAIKADEARTKLMAGHVQNAIATHGQAAKEQISIHAAHQKAKIQVTQAGKSGKSTPSRKR